MHQTLLLVTPVLRFNNLKHILVNIKNVFKNEVSITPLWVLCIDRFNCIWNDNDIECLAKECNESGIQIAVYYQGESDGPNYGGALMNAPLEDLKNNYFKHENPLMIVLDDDNIISPNLLTFIHEHCMNDENNIWILNMLSEGGDIRFSRSIDFLTGNKFGKYKVYHTCATIDPSQILFRLDLFFKVGKFDDGKFYDFKLMTKFDNDFNGIKSYLKFQMDYSLPAGLPCCDDKFYITSYHNGLVTNETLIDTIDDIENCKRNDSYIRVHVDDNYYNIQLSNDELKEILERHVNKK